VFIVCCGLDETRWFVKLCLDMVATHATWCMYINRDLRKVLPDQVLVRTVPRPRKGLFAGPKEARGDSSVDHLHCNDNEK